MRGASRRERTSPRRAQHDRPQRAQSSQSRSPLCSLCPLWLSPRNLRGRRRPGRRLAATIVVLVLVAAAGRAESTAPQREPGEQVKIVPEAPPEGSRPPGAAEDTAPQDAARLPGASSPQTTELSSPRSARLKAEVEALLALLDGAGPFEIWIVASKLGALGRDAAPILATELEKAGDVRRLAIGRALCTAGEPRLGGRALLELAREGRTSEIRTYAARSVALTPELLGLDPVTEALSALLESEPDPLVRVAEADALLRVVKGGGRRVFFFGGNGSRAGEGRAKALEFLARALEGEDRLAAREAALVLGENGFKARAHTRLVEIATEPTPDGKRALLILTRAPPEWVDLFDEITETIQKSYVDEESVDREALFDAAAKGMAESLDDFSTYLTVEDVKDMSEMLTRSYEGIGAWVGMRDGFFTVISPVYDGPAYRVGIRSLDRIIEVAGEPTGDLGFQKTIKRLKGPKDTPVVVKVSRRGWSEPQEFTIVREKITIRNCYHAALPGGIGYLRLTNFAEGSGEEVRAGVKALVAGRVVRTPRGPDRPGRAVRTPEGPEPTPPKQPLRLRRLDRPGGEGEGARSLVLDLRNNGGGLLSAAVEVADVFLDQRDDGLGRVIVYSQGRPEVAPQRRFFSRTDDALGGRPLVVLVNSGTASASEIVAGSLQDWGRARIVGEDERTFGKGSVQSLVALRAKGWSTKLRLTIARYYLPSQRCIDKEGIEPDVKVARAAMPPWETEAIVKAGLPEEIERYVRETFPLHADRFAELAGDDGRSLEAYPGLREFLGEFPEHVSDDSVRTLARASVRRRVADERGRRFVCDLQEDRVLRRGVYELLIQREDEGELPPVLQAIVDEFEDERAARETAAEAPAARK